MKSSVRQHFRMPEHVLVQEVQGEAVLLNLDSEQYYALNGTGLVVWRLLVGGSSLAHAAEALSRTYDIPVSEARCDVDALVAQLVTAGVLEGND